MAERKEQPASIFPDADALIQKAAGQRGMEAAQSLQRAAELLLKKGEVEQAYSCYERALGELSEQIGSPPAAKLGAALEFELGKLCEEELGRFEQALLHYQQAFKLRPDYLEPLRRGRLIYQSLGDMDMVARLIDLHLSNLVAGEAEQGIALALELGQLKLRLHDPGGAVEVLRSALRMHNEASEEAEVPEAARVGRGDERAGAIVETVICAIDRSPAGQNPLEDVGLVVRPVLTKVELDAARG